MGSQPLSKRSPVVSVTSFWHSYKFFIFLITLSDIPKWLRKLKKKFIKVGVNRREVWLVQKTLGVLLFQKRIASLVLILYLVQVIPNSLQTLRLPLNMFVFQPWSGRELMLGWPSTTTLGSLSTHWSPVRGWNPPPPLPPQWPGPIPMKSYAWLEMMDTDFCGWSFLMDQNRLASSGPKMDIFWNKIDYGSLLN